MPKKLFPELHWGTPICIRPSDAPYGSGPLHLVILSANGWDRAYAKWARGRYEMPSRSLPVCEVRVRNRPSSVIRTEKSTQISGRAPLIMWNHYGNLYWSPKETLDILLLDAAGDQDCVIAVAEMLPQQIKQGEVELPLKYSDGKQLGGNGSIKVNVILTPNMNLHPRELIFMVQSATGLYNIYDNVFGGYKSCPFVRCKVPGKEGMDVRTKTEQMSSDPTWNFPITFRGFELEDTLEFQVWHDKKTTLDIRGWDGGVDPNVEESKDKETEKAKDKAKADKEAAEVDGTEGKEENRGENKDGNKADTDDDKFTDILLGRVRVPADQLKPGDLTIRLSNVPFEDDRLFKEAGRPPQSIESFLQVKVFLVPRIIDTMHRANLRKSEAARRVLEDNPEPDITKDPQHVPIGLPSPRPLSPSSQSGANTDAHQCVSFEEGPRQAQREEQSPIQSRSVLETTQYLQQPPEECSSPSWGWRGRDGTAPLASPRRRQPQAQTVLRPDGDMEAELASLRAENARLRADMVKGATTASGPPLASRSANDELRAQLELLRCRKDMLNLKKEEMRLLQAQGCQPQSDCSNYLSAPPGQCGCPASAAMQPTPAGYGAAPWMQSRHFPVQIPPADVYPAWQDARARFLDNHTPDCAFLGAPLFGQRRASWDGPVVKAGADSWQSTWATSADRKDLGMAFSDLDVAIARIGAKGAAM